LYARNGIVASTDSDWGNALITSSGCAGGTPSDYVLYDPKNSFAGSSWAFSGGSGQTVGGYNFSNNSATDIWSFTPSVSTDTIVVWSFCYLGNSGAAFTVSDNGTLLGTVTASGVCASSSPGALVQSTFTRTGSTNPIKIARTGGSVIIQAVDSFSSGAATTPTQVRISNWGAYGSDSSYWITNTFNHFPYPAMAAMNPDLVVLDLGINDYRNGKSAAAFQTNMQSIITNLKSQNIDIVLVRPQPDNAPVYASLYQQYKFVYYALSKANGIPLVDLNSRLGTWATAQANGEYGSSGANDSVHLSQIGYADVAQALWQVLRPQ
jgi:hypothetical protein